VREIDKVQGALIQQCDINDSMVALFREQDSRLRVLESELAAIQEALAYVEAGK